jgi:endonuclease-3
MSPTTKKKVSPKKESPDHLRSRAVRILRTLRKEFPQPKTALLHHNPFQLLVATILSAQCTDERVNMVTPGLFAKWQGPVDFAALSQPELELEIRSTGFFRVKAKSIIACSKALIERHKGVVPHRMEDLVQLPGVGRKTANVVLGQAYGINSGIVVDTHVHRLSQRLGLTDFDTPEQIEQDLMALFPTSDWIDVGSILILHGRRTCNARKPICLECSIRGECPSKDLFLKQLR